jgi:hypothetical protein
LTECHVKCNYKLWPAVVIVLLLLCQAVIGLRLLYLIGENTGAVRVLVETVKDVQRGSKQ